MLQKHFCLGFFQLMQSNFKSSLFKPIRKLTHPFHNTFHCIGISSPADPPNHDKMVNVWLPRNHINVESTLKQQSPTFINVVSALKFGWKWKLSRCMFIDVVSTLTKQRRKNVDRITLIQCWWPNVVTFSFHIKT